MTAQTIPSWWRSGGLPELNCYESTGQCDERDALLRAAGETVVGNPARTVGEVLNG